MAIFSDNDRGKVDEEIKIEEDLDEIVDDDSADDAEDQNNDNDQEDQEDSSKKQTKTDDDSADQTQDEKNSAEYWKQKFSDSTREAQLIAERERIANEKLAEATKPKEITDDLMKSKYPDWDAYDDGVKAALKNQVKLEQEVNQLKTKDTEYHNERKWNGQIQSFLDENAETEIYPLQGRETEFRKFVNKPERKGMDLKVLAGSFLFEVKDTKKPKTAPKGDMLNTGSGAGATGKHKTDKKKLDADDARRLRLNNPKEYERKIRSGELDIKL